MAYRVFLTPHVERCLLRLPPGVDRRIEAAISTLGRSPRPAGVKKLSGGEDLYRVRVGSYRIIYRVQDALRQVLVINIGHRGDVYRRR